MLLSREYLQRLIREGGAGYAAGSEGESIINENPSNPSYGKRYVAVDRYDKQRVDHYEVVGV